MATNFIIYSEKRRRAQQRRAIAARVFAGLALTQLSASCIDAESRVAALPGPTVDPGAYVFNPDEIVAMTDVEAYAANAAIPLSGLPDGGAAPVVIRGATALDQMRSLDCLSQAIYYEARSESEDGQRAVAQVVLNRVRNAAYPASVCGVVYQGPMRAGGGCQFTFTCDGSLSTPPRGLGWFRARQLAAEALAGHVYVPVGHATHYHTTAVFPRWAPSLVKSALIGNHIFYRLPGGRGEAGAFRQGYAGREPLPVPTRIFFPRPVAGKTLTDAQLASLALPASGALAEPAAFAAPPDTLPQVRLTERGLPASRVRDEFSRAGAVRADIAPAPMTEAIE